MNKPRRTWLLGTAAGSLGAMTGLPLAALAEAANNGTVVVGSTTAPEHLNSAIQPGLATMLPAAQLFASPLRMDEQWRPQPYLAEAWRLSKDQLSLHLKLNKAAQFHDGAPVTTADLLFSIETVQRHHPFKSLLAPVNAVTIEDRQSAVIRLAHPHPALVSVLSTPFMPILPKHVFGDGQNINAHPGNLAPIGSGPFKLVDFARGEQIVLERFSEYFEPAAPKLRRILYRRYASPAALLTALAKGEVDLHLQLNSTVEMTRAEKDDDLRVLKDAAPALGPLVWLAFNTRHPKLSDKRVRQAINYALDKEFIVNTVLGGLPKRSTGPIASASPFYSARVNHYPQNLEKAKALLESAGLSEDDNGVRLSLQIDALPGNPDVKLIQEYLIPSLAKVGIQASLRSSREFKTWARRIANHDFEVTVDSVWNWGDPVVGVHRTWDSKNIRKGVIWSNTQQYANPKVDELLKAGASTADDEARKTIYAELQSVITDDCPVAFLCELPFNYGINRRVADPPRSVWGMLSPATRMHVKTST